MKYRQIDTRCLAQTYCCDDEVSNSVEPTQDESHHTPTAITVGKVTLGRQKATRHWNEWTRHHTGTTGTDIADRTTCTYHTDRWQGRNLMTG